MRIAYGVDSQALTITLSSAGSATGRSPSLKKILDVWCEFLSGPDSRCVLNDGPTGWKSPRSRAFPRALSCRSQGHESALH
ncbi:MAG: phophatidylserine decarboxylase associated domain-containing protein [Solirubrobacteraceae bacterium]